MDLGTLMIPHHTVHDTIWMPTFGVISSPFTDPLPWREVYATDYLEHT